MSLDITPQIPSGRSLIQSYGSHRFRISNHYHDGSVIVFPEQVESWSATTIDEITLDSLEPVLKRKDDVDMLLIGCGESFVLPPKGLKMALKEQGIVLEWMDSRAACRTFNVLLSEERLAAAAILAID